MADGDIDLAYALHLLDRINALTVNGIRLSETTLSNGYNFWQFFQQHFIFNDIKHFSVTRQMPAPAPAALHGRIIAFAAFWVLFAVSVVAILQLLVSKNAALVYSVDRISARKFKSDFRLEKLYQFLHDQRLSYVEAFHTPLTLDTLKTLMRRRRAALYLTVLEGALFPFLPKTPVSFVEAELARFTPDERSFVVKFVTRYYQFIPLAERKIDFLAWLMRRTRPKVFITIDDVRYWNELLIASRLSGVPSIAFQHGHYTKYHIGFFVRDGFTGMIAAPDTLVVWSEYWKQELVKRNPIVPEERIAIGGNSREGQAEQEIHRAQGGVLQVVYPYEIDGYRAEIAAYLKKVAACPYVRLYFKLRQDIDRKLQLRAFRINEIPENKVTVITFLSEMREGVSLAIGSYSTFLYNMIEDGIPVGMIPTASDFGEGLLANDLAAELPEISADVCSGISRAAEPSPELLAERAEKLKRGEESDMNAVYARLILPHFTKR